MTASQGQHTWYELMTSDVEAAKTFYTEIIGWKLMDWEEGEKPYTMWTVGNKPVGGVLLLPDEAKAMGAPPHWIAYIATPDVDATGKKAEELGGKVLKSMDIPKVGRFCVIQDPQGAVFAAFRAESEVDLPDREQPGMFSWHELNTTDYEKAWTFYQALFDWEPTTSMDMGPMGTYWMYQDKSSGGNSIGGMCNVAKVQNIPPSWLYYITVDNVDTTIERIKSKNGKILNGPMEVPGGGKIAQCVDPQGVAFAIYAKS